MINNFFSIIICCYNSEQYLENTIDSVINQNYSNWELLLIDNGSVDKTESIIKKYLKLNNNIYFYKEKNIGLSNARNKGLNKSKSDWIVLLDHDDIMSQNRLNYHNQDINSHKNINFFFGDAKIFDDSGILNNRFKISIEKDNFNPTNLNLKKKYGFINLVQYGCFIVSSTVCFNKKVFMKVNKFNSKYKFISDYIFFLDVSKHYDIFCSEQIFCEWRMHSNQSTNKLKSTYFYELNILYFLFYFNRFIGLKLKFIILIKNLKLIINFLLKK
tara:strand:+ start:7409 stop:8224 length:816 start_codon:yes stop_codon:yes gene_type:complete